MNEEMFARTRTLLGEAAFEALKKSRMAVIGVGGVGGHCAEALVRSGVCNLLLVDDDTVALSNLNRQAAAWQSTLGKPKVEAMRARLLDLNPQAQIDILFARYLPAETHGVWDWRPDIVLDAVDTVAAKVDLAFQAQARGVMIVSCMGAGNKRDPFRFETADLYQTDVCPLCRAMRRACRARGVERLRVIYSREQPCVQGIAQQGRCGRPAPASIVTVTGTAGLLLANEAIRMITQDC